MHLTTTLVSALFALTALAAPSSDAHTKKCKHRVHENANVSAFHSLLAPSYPRVLTAYH